MILDDLFHPHSLEIADFDGDGRPEIFVAEMGLGKHENPRMMLLHHIDGDRFEVFHEGTPVHEAKAADLTGNGLPDIVGKPYHPQAHVEFW